MCHHRRPRQLDAAPRREPTLRAADSDREQVVTELREHGAAGRLDVEELEQRIGSAYTARTYGELQTLVADLPQRRVAPAPRPDWHGSHDWRTFFAVNALLVAIWAVSGAGYFWPMWVMAWWAFALLMKSAPGLLRAATPHGRGPAG